jgi:hypothetical protein
MIGKLLPASIGLATGALALGYGLGGLWTWMPLIVALAFLWPVGQWRGWGWSSSLGLVFSATLAAVGLLLGLAAGWMLLGLVAALAAWDMDGFRQRLRSVERVDAPAQRDLERRHIQRLLAVAGLGLLLAAVVLGIRLELKFGAVLLLGLLAILGLSQAIGFLNRESH